MTKSYTELMSISSFDDRLAYLQEHGSIGSDTFGSQRYLNQAFYTSEEWKAIRRDVILRDAGCDLGVLGMEIDGRCIIHHINSITPEDVINRAPCLFDMENLICTSPETHRLIHYGVNIPKKEFQERRPNDTCPWK